MDIQLSPRIYGRATRERPDKERNPQHRKWIRTFACILYNRPEDHVCEGPIECCHVKSGNGATNRSKASDAKTIPMCRKLHHEQTVMGEARFQLKYAIDMNAYADAYAKASPFLKQRRAIPQT